MTTAISPTIREPATGGLPHLCLVPPARQAARRPAAERRRQIVSAAAAIVAEEGLARLRVGDVALRSGVAKTTVYLYFPTRDRLVLETVARIVSDHLEPVTRPALSGSPSAPLVDFLRELWQAARHPAVRAVFSGGPGPIALESRKASELVMSTVSALVARLRELSARPAGNPELGALAPVLVGGLLVSSGWSEPTGCEALIAALTT